MYDDKQYYCHTKNVMNERSEISINFKDYIQYTLHRWRWMVLSMVLLGVIFGGLYLINKLSNWDNTVADYNSSMAEYDEEYKDYSQQVAAWQAEIDYEKNKKESISKYVQESIFYGLDSDNALITTGDIFIQPVGSDYDINKIKSVTALYGDLIKYSINWSEIGEIVNLSEKNVRELVSIDVDSDANVISLRVFYPDEGSSEIIINKIYELAENESGKLGQIESFKTSLYNISSFYDRISEIEENRNEVNERYDELTIKIKSAKNSMDSIEEPIKPEPISRRKYILMAVLLGIIGMFIGLLLVFVACYNKFAKKGIVYSAGEFEKISGINNLGVYSRKKKYHFLAIIDRIIDKHTNDYSDEDDDIIDKKIILNIKNKISDEKNVLILGNTDEDNVSNVVKVLSKGLDDINFDSSIDVCDSIDTIEKIIASDAVILVSERDKTGLPVLFKTVKLVNNYDKDIIGNIVY